MADSDYLKDKLAQVIMEATHVSLHSADPAGTGAAEIAGGDPAYARVAITLWEPRVGGLPGEYTATLAGPLNLPPNISVLWAGLWNGTQYLDKAPCVVSTTVQDTLNLSVIFSAV